MKPKCEVCGMDRLHRNVAHCMLDLMDYILPEVRSTGWFRRALNAGYRSMEESLLKDGKLSHPMESMEGTKGKDFTVITEEPAWTADRPWQEFTFGELAQFFNESNSCSIHMHFKMDGSSEEHLASVEGQLKSLAWSVHDLMGDSTGDDVPERKVYMAYVNQAGAVFVKNFEFFREQGGLVETWGEKWVPIVATSIEDARTKAYTNTKPCNHEPNPYW